MENIPFIQKKEVNRKREDCNERRSVAYKRGR